MNDFLMGEQEGCNNFKGQGQGLGFQGQGQAITGNHRSPNPLKGCYSYD